MIRQSYQLPDSFCLLLVEVLHGGRVLENEEETFGGSLITIITLAIFARIPLSNLKISNESARFKWKQEPRGRGSIIFGGLEEPVGIK